MRVLTGGRQLLVAGVLVWAAAGCGSAVEGEAERASGQEGLFNPCTDIPDSVIEGVGLDPSTEKVDILGVEQPGWKICSWESNWYGLTVFSTSYTLTDVRNNPDFVDLEDVDLGDRNAIQYRRSSDNFGEGCYVGFAVEQGSMWINVDRMLSKVQEQESCEVALRSATELDNFLPQ